MADATADRDAARVAVALLEGERLADALAARCGHTVVATTPETHVEVVDELAAGGAELVVGVAATPWPAWSTLHARVADEVAVYRGVVSWHGLPLLAEALAQAAANGVRAGAHLLVTAPDPGPDAPPDEVVFLREVAEDLAARTGAEARSIAWRGDTRTPTAAAALTSLLTVHGRRDVLEVPIAPGTPADPALLAVAEEHGGRLTTVDVRAAFVLEALTAVVATVDANEREGPA